MKLIYLIWDSIGVMVDQIRLAGECFGRSKFN